MAPAVAAFTPLRDALVGPNARLETPSPPSIASPARTSRRRRWGAVAHRRRRRRRRRRAAGPEASSRSACIGFVSSRLWAPALLGLAKVGLFPAARPNYAGVSAIDATLVFRRFPGRASPCVVLPLTVRHAPRPEHGRHVPAPRQPQSREAPGDAASRTQRRRRSRFVQPYPTVRADVCSHHGYPSSSAS